MTTSLYNPTSPNPLAYIPDLTEFGESSSRLNDENSRHIFYTQSIDLETVATNLSVPLSLAAFNFLLCLLFIGFAAQLILAFVGLAFINGFIALMGSVVTFGLLRVFYRVFRIVKRKNV